MRKSLWALLFMGAMGMQAQTSFNYKNDHAKLIARTSDSKDALYFDTQIKRFKQHDLTQTDLEVLSLLLAQSQRPEFGPFKETFRETIIKELAESGKYKEALEMANKLLKGNPLNIKGIYQKAFLLRKLEQNDSVKLYDKQWQKILKAMFLSGKGTTQADPTFSLGLDDGTVFINAFIGAEVTGRRTEKNAEGQTLAVYEALLDKKKLTLYFLIDHAEKRQQEEQSQK